MLFQFLYSVFSLMPSSVERFSLTLLSSSSRITFSVHERDPCNCIRRRLIYFAVYDDSICYCYLAVVARSGYTALIIVVTFCCNECRIMICFGTAFSFSHFTEPVFIFIQFQRIFQKAVIVFLKLAPAVTFAVVKLDIVSCHYLHQILHDIADFLCTVYIFDGVAVSICMIQRFY